MPCLLVLIAVVLPRFTMFFIWLTTDWFNRAYQSVIWPLLGFWLMPFTTLTYMAAMFNNDHQLTGGWLVLFIFAISIDLSSDGASIRGRHEQSRP